MIRFKQYGYSPDNFALLVELSGLTNEQFYEQNNISRRSFYLYKSGEVSVRWQDWQGLAKKYGININVKA